MAEIPPKGTCPETAEYSPQHDYCSDDPYHNIFASVPCILRHPPPVGVFYIGNPDLIWGLAPITSLGVGAIMSYR